MHRCIDALSFDAHHLCMHCDSHKKSVKEEEKDVKRESERMNGLFGFDLQPRYIQLIISKIEPISEFSARK